MKIYYPNNTRFNKAAMILAIMSDDMVEDIADLILSRGRAVIADVSSPNEGSPKPLAVFSRSYIADEDFGYTFTGFATVVLASMRTLKSDFDFYESTLMNAFSLPRQIASPMAKNIETYDVLGGMAAEDKRSWATKMSQTIQEEIRQGSNWVANVLQVPFENDQDQRFDIDYLYELKLLGQGVDNLASRSRLMTGQAAIAQGQGLFRIGDGESGDVEGGDPHFEAETYIGDVFQPLMGSPLPHSIFGGLRGIAAFGRTASRARAHKVLQAAGLSTPGRRGHSADSHQGGHHQSIKAPLLRKAIDKITHMKPGKLAMLAGGIGFAPLAIKAIAGLIKNHKGAQQTGDVSERLADHFGHDVAGAWETGDVVSLLEHLAQLTGDPDQGFETTGDPDLDEAIIGDVLNEIEQEGDIYESGDVEIGGLFKRWRINAAIRRGKRRHRRSFRRAAKQRRKDEEQRQLERAKDYARESDAASQYSEDQDDTPPDNQDEDEGSAGYDVSSFS